MVIAALMLTVMAFSQSDKSLRRDVAKNIDESVIAYKDIYTTRTGFSDKESAMVIVVTEKIDTHLSAKEMWHSIHDVWDEIDQEIMIKYLKVENLRIVIIDINGDIEQYKRKIIDKK